MDDEMIQKFLDDHLKSYQKAILEIIQNNTTVLLNDISSLIMKPPLDSMDYIKNKFLPLLPYNYHLLEVKYDAFLPNWISDILQTDELEQISFSKYCMARRLMA